MKSKTYLVSTSKKLRTLTEGTWEGAQTCLTEASLSPLGKSFPDIKEFLLENYYFYSMNTKLFGSIPLFRQVILRLAEKYTPLDGLLAVTDIFRKYGVNLLETDSNGKNVIYFVNMYSKLSLQEKEKFERACGSRIT